MINLEIKVLNTQKYITAWEKLPFQILYVCSGVLEFVPLWWKTGCHYHLDHYWPLQLTLFSQNVTECEFHPNNKTIYVMYKFCHRWTFHLPLLKRIFTKSNQKCKTIEINSVNVKKNMGKYNEAKITHGTNQHLHVRLNFLLFQISHT